MSSTSMSASWLASLSSAADESSDVLRALARCGRGLYRYFVVRTGGDAHLADDLMQRLYLKAAKGATAVPSEEIEYWLKRVATNLIREHWRKQARRPAHVPLAEPALAAELAEKIAKEQLPEAFWERKEAQDQLILAVTDLPGEEQELIVGHYFQSESHARLARRLGISERAVEGRLYRARQALREKLRNLDVGRWP